MLRPFPINSNYVAVVRSLLRIHRLWLDGKGESTEADAIRDAMDAPWQLLSDAEQKRLRGLSEDLNTINGDTPQNAAMNPQAQAKLVEANEARLRGEWDRTLAILRRWGKHVAPSLLAYLRGSIWFAAGDAETAAIFYECATNLEPQNGNYQALWLDVLQKVDREKAISEADKVLRDPEKRDPVVVVHAAHILIGQTKEISVLEARPTFELLLPILEHTQARLQTDDDSDNVSLLATVSFIGLCHEGLGNIQSALNSYSKGLEIDPDNEALLIARGRLLYGTSPRAPSDFERAIHVGTPQVWPYFFLAHFYFLNDRFEECRSMCERALRKPAAAHVQSELLEWLAISQAGLSYPTEVIRASFESAIRIDPSNDRARKNLSIFEEIRASQLGPISNWTKRSATLVRTLGQEEMRKGIGPTMGRQLELV